MKKVLYAITLVSLFLGVFSFSTLNVLAVEGTCRCYLNSQPGQPIDIPTDEATCTTMGQDPERMCGWSANADASGGGPATSITVKLDNPLGAGENAKDIRVIIGNIIKVVLGLVGSLALVIFVYGGLLWMTSAGNAERIKSGRDTLIWASLGFIVIFTSYILVGFLLQTITQQGAV